MNKIVRKLTFEEAKDEEYRYWQGVSPSERIAAAWELSIEQYRMKGIEPNGQALRRSVVCFQRP
jgi:hypothetical protein